MVGTLSYLGSETVDGAPAGTGFAWGAAMLFAATGRQPLRLKA
ncbi:hypothetical protein [Actinomadura rubrobrunea]|nr:hypothetical protein [Actinomadura rubrobrunea]